MSNFPLFSDETKPLFDDQMLAMIRDHLVALAHDAILVRDPTSTIVFWNRGAEELYGWTAQEALGKVIHELLQTCFPLSREDIDNHLATGKQWEGELLHTCKNGMQVIVESRQVMLCNDRNQPIAILEINRDITGRKQREQENREHLRFQVEMSKVLTSTLDYPKTLANIARLVVPQLADWFAVDLMNAEGQFELIEVMHKDPAQIAWARALRERYPIDPNASIGPARVVRTGRSELYPEITDEMLVATAGDEDQLAIARQVGYTSVMIVPLVARGKTLGAVTFVMAESGRRYDETDLALAEVVGLRVGVALDNARLYREVTEARDQLNIILQGVADGIVVYDANSCIIYANDAAAQLTDLPSTQDLIDMPPDALSARYKIVDEQGHPLPSSQLPHKRVLAGAHGVQAIIGYSLNEDPIRWSLVKVRPVLDEQGKVIYAISIFHDMTERVRTEQRKDEFISITSHELRTPVTSLKGFTHVLRRRLAKQGDDQALYYLTRMDAQLNKLNKLISDLLDVSRIQSGKLTLREELFDLDALVQETIENVQMTTTTHQILIEGNICAQIYGDRDRIGQVIINLLTNAVKYSPQTDKVVVHLSRDNDQQHATISVQDFGIGIAQAYHQKIFERFYQINDAEEKTYPGLGMGLHIAREIVERHHGRIWVKSRKGKGATFFVTLPLRQGS